ncbi:MAG: FAD-dependent oxidoreductase, partial [Pseudomonadota bacterium]
MGVAGEVLHIPHDKVKRLLVEQSGRSDIFVRGCTARREFGRSEVRGGIVIIGEEGSRLAFGLRTLLDRHGAAHTYLDADEDNDAPRLMAELDLARDDLPVVLRGSLEPLRRPAPEDLARELGLNFMPEGAAADVVVVGAGPAGLAASVYAASEGLSVITLDSTAPGGQAGTSSKIENYLGFPTGISGQQLAENASVQAQKFGARIVAPIAAESMKKMEGDYLLTLTDGRKVKARSVVIACGARYRNLPVENDAEFEGRGIHYGATPLEAQLCHGADVALVGAGNSAGQGAVYLSETANKVYVVYRRADIRETMSEYLVRRLEEMPNIELVPSTEVSALQARDDSPALGKVTFKNRESGEEQICDVNHLFLFLGAEPCTDWLPKEISRDSRGFVKTGTDIENIELVKAGWQLDRMPTKYETGWPRVYAVGDARHGSVKRVASGVGEGSVVVSDVHAALAEAARSEAAE